VGVDRGEGEGLTMKVDVYPDHAWHQEMGTTISHTGTVGESPKQKSRGSSQNGVLTRPQQKNSQRANAGKGWVFRRAQKRSEMGRDHGEIGGVAQSPRAGNGGAKNSKNGLFRRGQTPQKFQRERCSAHVKKQTSTKSICKIKTKKEGG